MDIFSTTTGKRGEDLVPYILKGLDNTGLKAYNAFDMTHADRRDPTRIYEKFEEVLNISKTNFRATRLDYF